MGGWSPRHVIKTGVVGENWVVRVEEMQTFLIILAPGDILGYLEMCCRDIAKTGFGLSVL